MMTWRSPSPKRTPVVIRRRSNLPSSSVETSVTSPTLTPSAANTGAPRRVDRLPPQALAAAISLFEAWLTLAAFGEKTLSPLLLQRFADVLVAEIEEHDRPLPRPGEALPEIKYAVGRDALENARHQLALHARSSPSAASRYLSAIAKSKQASRKMLQLLEFPGNLASAAPCRVGALSHGQDPKEKSLRSIRCHRSTKLLLSGSPRRRRPRMTPTRRFHSTDNSGTASTSLKS